MVDFLANKGVDISLLTFHGFEQDGKMMLTRLTQVAADAESVSSQSQPRKRVSKAEWRERLATRAEEGEVLDVFNDALEMFRKEFNHPTESAGAKGIAMHLHLSGRGQRSFARVEPEQGQVRILFYGSSVEPCREDFHPLLDEIRYETWPRNRQETPLIDSPPEIQFLVTTEEWETYKGKLHDLTGAVYATIRKAES